MELRVRRNFSCEPLGEPTLPNPFNQFQQGTCIDLVWIVSLMPVHQQFRRRTFLIVRDCRMTGTHLRSPTSAGGLEEPIDTYKRHPFPASGCR
jgi:hypothetical protein